MTPQLYRAEALTRFLYQSQVACLMSVERERERERERGLDLPNRTNSLVDSWSSNTALTGGHEYSQTFKAKKSLCLPYIRGVLCIVEGLSPAPTLQQF